MNHPAGNIDPAEVAKFDALGTDWWDPKGPLATLHAINPLRLGYIEQRVRLGGSHVLDVGCGAGLLTEAIARAGAVVTGIDLAASSIASARAHADAEGLEIEYDCVDVEAIAARRQGHFDVVTCLELLEHVPDPAATIQACSQAVRPGGSVFFSTLNRNPKSFALAILMAEYVLGMVPRGTHQYRRFIQPAELARWCRRSDLTVLDVTGLHFNPLLQNYSLGGNADVNYLCHAVRRPAV